MKKLGGVCSFLLLKHVTIEQRQTQTETEELWSSTQIQMPDCVTSDVRCQKFNTKGVLLSPGDSLW